MALSPASMQSSRRDKGQRLCAKHIPVAKPDQQAAEEARQSGSSPEISPASREVAEFAAALAPVWSESSSRSYCLSEDPARASEKPPEPG